MKRSIRRATLLFVLPFLAAGAVLGGGTAQAGPIYTWDNGAADGDWSNPVNWVGDSGYPNAIDDVADFNATSAVNLSENIIIGTLDSNQVTINSTTSNTLTFDVASGKAEIKANGKTNTFNAGVVLNDDLLVSGIGGSNVTFNGAVTGSKDIYLAPDSTQGNADRFKLGLANLTNFTGDIYLMDQTGTTFAIMSTQGFSSSELASSTIYMGLNSRIDGVRDGGGVIAADIVVQKDAYFYKNGNKGGFQATGVISGSGKLSIFTDNGGPKQIIAGANPNILTGDVVVYSNGTSYGVCSLQKDGALGTAPTLTVGAGAILEITSSGGAEDRIWDGTKVYLSYNYTTLAYYGRMTLATGVDESVAELYLDNVKQLAGTWGSSSSAAAYTNDNYFTGAGIVTVLPEPATLALLGLGGLILSRKRR